MASPAPVGRGSRNRRAPSKGRARNKSQGAGPSAAPRLALPDPADLQYAAQQTQLYKQNAQAEAGRVIGMSVQEQEKLLREVMRLMLFRQKAQPDVPVPRNDLTKVILASYKDGKKSNMGNAIVALAQESFAKVMGMDMRELRIAPVSKGKSRITENDAGGSKFYVLRSLVPTNWKRKFVADESQNPSRHLLIILLMLIKCQGDKLSEEDMWQYLSELGVQQREVHFKLGKVEDEIKTLVQKKYLIQRKQNGADGNSFTYEAGPNATDELEPKGGIDAYVDQLFTDSLVQPSADQAQDMEME
ncbi:MAG: hypothetical protein FRX49_13668 [Trebouxia sp. A1-2]|nr:MAG: hypothetical protein FRX49_13668 [Trebouxia sp. A1-2]